MFEPCECGSGMSYLGCCGRLHSGTAATNAEELMRSRYTAYCRKNEKYLLKSWAAETRPLQIDFNPAQVWTGLAIENHEGISPETETVRFTATWRSPVAEGSMTETSRFRREGDGWVYIDGIIDEDAGPPKRGSIKVSPGESP